MLEFLLACRLISIYLRTYTDAYSKHLKTKINIYNVTSASKREFKRLALCKKLPKIL